jgi:hypothetical protein
MIIRFYVPFFAPARPPQLPAPVMGKLPATGKVIVLQAPSNRDALSKFRPPYLCVPKPDRHSLGMSRPIIVSKPSVVPGIAVQSCHHSVLMTMRSGHTFDNPGLFTAGSTYATPRTPS